MGTVPDFVTLFGKAEFIRRARLTYPSTFHYVLNRGIKGESENPGSLFIAYSPVNLDAGFEYGQDERIAFIESFGTVRQRIDAFINCTAQRHDHAAVRKTIKRKFHTS